MSTITVPGAGGAVTPPPANGRKRWQWSREQYRTLVEQGHFDGKRVELIHGEIVEMSPINWPHQLAKIKVARLLQAAFGKAAWVNEQGPLVAAGSEPQPDAAVISGRPEDYTDHPQTALLVVEVADTSLADDTTTKAELYATANIPEYWVLDLNGRQLHVYRAPAALSENLGAISYATHLTLGASDTVSRLAAPSATVRVADLLP
jgi:Uma2 family endonuclease